MKLLGVGITFVIRGSFTGSPGNIEGVHKSISEGMTFYLKDGKSRQSTMNADSFYSFSTRVDCLLRVIRLSSLTLVRCFSLATWRHHWSPLNSQISTLISNRFRFEVFLIDNRKSHGALISFIPFWLVQYMLPLFPVLMPQQPCTLHCTELLSTRWFYGSRRQVQLLSLPETLL